MPIKVKVALFGIMAVLMISTLTLVCKQVSPEQVPSLSPVPTQTVTPTTKSDIKPNPDPVYIVVDTAQDKCYDNSREISYLQLGESFCGQDAQHQSITD
ncbi:hypothetical protein ACFLXD_04935 [Chloroflexota bacterium]